MTRYRAGEHLPYFCTITVLDWLPVLIEARCIDPIVESLSFCRQTKSLQLFAFVVMPNHLHVIAAAKAGAHIATMPYSVLKAMLRHPLTDVGIERFLADAAKAAKAARSKGNI